MSCQGRSAATHLWSDAERCCRQHNYLWGQASNLMMVPSDCDNRDERFGWTGDSALTADEASVNFDLSSFCESQPLLLWCACATLC